MGTTYQSHIEFYGRGSREATVSIVDNQINANYAAQVLYIRNSDQVTVIGNHFNVSSASNMLLVQSSSNLTLRSNNWTDSSTTGPAMAVAVDSLTMVNELVDHVNIGGVHSLLSIDVDDLEVVDNTFSNCSGHSMFQIQGAPPQVNFERNLFKDCDDTDFFVKTTVLYGAVEGGIYTIGPNYWGLPSFDALSAKTYDSLDDPNLATILHSGIFLNEDLSSYEAAPPASQSCIDEDTGTIECVITAPVTIVIRGGTYNATGPVILRHPNAALLIESGVTIKFAPSASLVVDFGTIQVVGTADQPVNLMLDSDPENMEAHWGGVFLRRDMVGSRIINGVYIGGSAFRHCIVSHAGATGAAVTSQATIYFESVIIEEAKRDGLALEGLDSAVLKNIQVHRSGQNGVKVSNVGDTLLFLGVNVTESGNDGVVCIRHRDIVLQEGSFKRNSNSNFHSQYGVGWLNVSRR